LTGVFPGKESVLDPMKVGEGKESALRAARDVLEATRLQPSMAQGIVSHVAQQSIDIGLAENAGMGEVFGHEVCVGVWVSKAIDYRV